MSLKSALPSKLGVQTPQNTHRPCPVAMRSIKNDTMARNDVSADNYLSRRVILGLLPSLALIGGKAQAEEDFAFTLAENSDAESAQVAGPVGEDLSVRLYTSATYTLEVPTAWEQKEKAGADSLFEDPNQRSTSVGVTVAPVRVPTIDKFGSVEFVGKKLVDAEKAKESTLNISLVRQESRTVDDVLYYDFEYVLDSTRGRKRIFNTVTIFNSRLFILNAVAKCAKEDEACSQPVVYVLRAVAESLRVKL